MFMPVDNNSNSAATNGSRRDQIAMIVLISTIGGLVIFAAPLDCLDKANAQGVFNALLPIFGPWVGMAADLPFEKTDLAPSGNSK
jgi:hypothetical protein